MPHFLLACSSHVVRSLMLKLPVAKRIKMQQRERHTPLKPKQNSCGNVFGIHHNGFDVGTCHLPVYWMNWALGHPTIILGFMAVPSGNQIWPVGKSPNSTARMGKSPTHGRFSSKPRLSTRGIRPWPHVRFLKWGYPEIIHFNKMFHCKPTILIHFGESPILGNLHMWSNVISPHFRTCMSLMVCQCFL